MTLGTLPHWVENEFTTSEAQHLRRELPLALARAQRQGANAHDGFDPDGTELYVYGMAMSRADYDQVRGSIATLESFSTVRPENAKRDVLLVNRRVILVLRIGTKMPQRYDRVRLKSVSAFRENLLSATSMTKYDHVLDLFRDEDGEAEQEVEEAELDFLRSAAAKNSLVVVYYSSTPSGLGSMYWAPAIFGERNQLRFTDPERLVLDETGGSPQSRPRPVPIAPDAFGAGERPVPAARLRPRQKPVEG